MVLTTFAGRSFAQPESEPRVVCFTIGEAQEILDTLDIGNVNRSTVEVQKATLAHLMAQIASYKREAEARIAADSIYTAIIAEKDVVIKEKSDEIWRLQRKLRRARGGFFRWMERIGLSAGSYYLGNRYPMMPTR